MLRRAVLGLFLMLVLASAAPALAPADLAGSWLGTLELGPINLRLGFNLAADPSGGLTGSLVSIDQGGVVIPVNGVALIDDELTLTIKPISGKFVGRVGDAGDSIDGEWSQAGINAPLKLERVDELPGQDRPQNPKDPLPYRVEEVKFKNPDAGHTLAGTLTLPEGPGPFGAAVLVSGSGPQDRDESLFGHKPFLVLADALTRRGVAVLRYDDRGHGESTGDFGAATSVDFASDATAAVRFLAGREEINAGAIGVCGHSEGGLIGPMVAAAHPDEVAFLVLIAPPGVVGSEIIHTQAAAMEKLTGIPDDAIAAMAKVREGIMAIDPETMDESSIEERVRELAAQVPDAYFQDAADKDAARETIVTASNPMLSPWFQYFLKHDPQADLRRVACPVLAIVGEKDLQVLPDVNLPPLRAALEAAPTDDVTVRELPDLNHLLQTAETGMVSEYGTIEETIAPEALRLIGSWTAERVGPRE